MLTYKSIHRCLINKSTNINYPINIYINHPAYYSEYLAGFWRKSTIVSQVYKFWDTAQNNRNIQHGEKNTVNIFLKMVSISHSNFKIFQRDSTEQ